MMHQHICALKFVFIKCLSNASGKVHVPKY